MWHDDAMPKMIQVRNVPDKLHAELTRRARKRRQTLTDYVQSILEREVSNQPREKVLDWIDSRERVNVTAAEIVEWIRSDREER
jgi:antitoxin FitA